MIRIQTSNLNLVQKKYSWTVLLEDLIQMSTPFEFEPSSNDAFDTLCLPNGKNIIIHHDFFSKPAILDAENLPNQLELLENNLVCFYGSPKIETLNEEINIYADIVGMVFFMLTRWEESLPSEKDRHDRFQSKHSFVVKNNIERRAIIDEWADWLSSNIKSLDSTVKFKEQKFRCFPTHDIDSLKKWSSIKSVLEHFWLGIKHKGIHYAFYNLFAGTLSVLGLRKDDNDTIYDLMKTSEINDQKSYFFFITGGKTKFEGRYDFEKDIPQSLLNEIEQRGHFLGLHPSYDSYNNDKIFKSEVQSAKKRFNPKFGRQHFLRFSIPETWKLWDEYSFTWESSVGFADQLGFRCGTCKSFRVFDISEEKMLNLKEMPLIVMDQTLINYLKLPPEKALEVSLEMVNTVKRHKGNFVILWHNASLKGSEFGKYRSVYESILKHCK
jgi:hypothetical protein